MRSATSPTGSRASSPTNETSVVNGSLWTLPVEIRAYLLVLVLGITGLLLRRLWLVVAAGLVLLAPARLRRRLDRRRAAGRVPRLPPRPAAAGDLRSYWGARLYVQRERVPLRCAARRRRARGLGAR